MVVYFNARWIVVNVIITTVVLVITIVIIIIVIIIVIIIGVLLPCPILDKINVSCSEFTSCANQLFLKLWVMIPSEGYDQFQERSMSSQELFMIPLYEHTILASW
jgi:hypothetical protein